jgi:outer membrane protein OmpA-like peptidoglycan-associated protein
MRTSLHKNKITSLLTGTTILIASFLATQTSVQAAPATNGPIFLQTQGTRLLNSDGTTVSAPRYLSGPPEYSHDGTKMAWLQGRNGGSDVKISNADGTSIKTLLDSTIQFQKLQFTSTGQIILAARNSGTLYSIDSVTENQTLSGSNEFLTLPVGSSITDFSVSKHDRLAYVNNQACPMSGNDKFAGIFTRAINGNGVGTLVSESCAATGVKRNSPIVRWNIDGDRLFVGQSEYVSSNAVEQRIVALDPDATSANRTELALIATETTVNSNNFEAMPTTLAVSPDGTKLALITKGLSETYKLWTLNSDGTGLLASSVTPTYFFMSWARPITLDAVTTTTSTTIAPTTTVETTTTVAATTTLAPTTTSTVPESVYASAVPGITVTDPTVYQTAPKQVAGESAIMVLSTAQNKIADVVSKTPSICLPSDNDLVFIDEGRCIAEVVNTKTRKVLRTLKTTVVADDISELEVGNEIAILTPLYFVAGTFDLKAQSLSRLTKLKDRVTSAGSVLVAGHSGVLMGNTPENIKLAKARADATVAILKARGAKGPFSVASVGALDPVTMVKTQAAQEKNRRVVIVLIP